MRDIKRGVSRRDMLAAAGGLSIAGALGTPSPDSAWAATTATQADNTTAQDAINALEGTYGVHPGQRRNHTKGTGARGTFVGSKDATIYSRSPLFSGSTIDVVARFSVAGGDPNASDTEKSPRGMALEFRLPGGALQHITMLDTPMFFAKTPRTFVDKILALKPDPATGQPDPQKVREFLATHPDNMAQAKFLTDHNPPPSYANAAYFGIHTFKFIDKAGKETPVRWRFVPQDGEKELSDAELKSMPRDFLEKVLIERSHTRPIRWTMIVTIGNADDPADDPTVLWPTNRKEITAGTLAITAALPSAESPADKINFDPLVMADGIAPTNDPILLFRSPSYGLSFFKRIRGV